MISILWNLPHISLLILLPLPYLEENLFVFLNHLITWRIFTVILCCITIMTLIVILYIIYILWFTMNIAHPHIMLFVAPSPLTLNLKLTNKLLNMIVGNKPWKLSFFPLIIIKPGLLLNFHQIKLFLDACGFISLSIEQMAPSKYIRHALLQKATLNLKVWICLIHSPQLPNSPYFEFPLS